MSRTMMKCSRCSDVRMEEPDYFEYCCDPCVLKTLVQNILDTNKKDDRN